jgi:hypothetical protein
LVQNGSVPIAIHNDGKNAHHPYFQFRIWNKSLSLNS